MRCDRGSEVQNPETYFTEMPTRCHSADLAALPQLRIRNHQSCLADGERA